MKNIDMKKIGKEVLSKLPIFIFCVVFISMHNKAYGEANSIIGVVLLIGLFMFMRGNLGFEVKQAVLCIPLLFLVVAVMPKLSLINPFLGLVVNFGSILLIMIISSHDISMSNHVPFMMGYIFCQGYDVSGRSYVMRVISLVIGSLVIAAIYYVINKKKTSKRTFQDLFKEINICSTRTQWYLKLAITLTLVMFVCDLLHYPRTMWISLAVLSLTTPLEVDHTERGKARIPAAILGTAVFFILFEVLIPVQYQSIVVLLAGFLSMFISNYFIKSIYNSFSSLGAAVLLFSTKGAIELRIISNIIGTIIAMISHYFFKYMFAKITVKHTKENYDESELIRL